MKTGKTRIQKYLVLVPHKETRQILQKYADDCIKKGLKGIYPFPFVAPIKKLEKPLSPEELKKYANELRTEMGKEKFTATTIESTPFNLGENNLSLYGTKISSAISAPQRLSVRNFIIGCWLKQEGSDISIEPPPPELSFRAAAVANFYIKPIIRCRKAPASIEGFKWKIGKLYWLPKKIKN